MITNLSALLQTKFRIGLLVPDESAEISRGRHCQQGQVDFLAAEDGRHHRDVGIWVSAIIVSADVPASIQEIAMISISEPDISATSPTDLPIMAIATGETKEIVPALGSASSSPTIRYF